MLATRLPPRSGVPSLITVLSVRCSRHDPSSKAYRTSPPIGVMDDVGYRPGAEDEVGAGRARTVHHLVGVRHPRRPAGRVARTERVGTVLLDHGRLARDDVEELVLLLMPVPIGGARPRLQRVDVGAELGQPALVGKMQPLGWAVIPRIFLVRVNYWRLIFSDDHLVPPFACAVRADGLNFAPLEASVQGERVPCNFVFTEF